MDPDEEEGVRAFALKVGAHAGASYPERPLWVERDGTRVDIAEVESQWREQERIRRSTSGPASSGMTAAHSSRGGGVRDGREAPSCLRA
jgi:hypothetical protein